MASAPPLDRTTRVMREDVAGLVTAADFARFEEKLFKNPDTGCWEWYGSRDDHEYARFWFAGRNWHAAQWVYLANGGDLPKDFEVDHTCECRYCVNPKHLEAVTREENQRRIWQRYYARKAHERAEREARNSAEAQERVSA